MLSYKMTHMCTPIYLPVKIEPDPRQKSADFVPDEDEYEEEEEEIPVIKKVKRKKNRLPGVKLLRKLAREVEQQAEREEKKNSQALAKLTRAKKLARSKNRVVSDT